MAERRMFARSVVGRQTYDVFIVDGSAFDPDAHYVRLCDLSKSELYAIQRVVNRQSGLDFVVRDGATENG